MNVNRIAAEQANEADDRLRPPQLIGGALAGGVGGKATGREAPTCQRHVR